MILSFDALFNCDAIYGSPGAWMRLWDFVFLFAWTSTTQKSMRSRPHKTSFGSCIFVDGFAWPGSLSKYEQYSFWGMDTIALFELD